MKALVAMLLVLVAVGCAHRRAAPPAEMSGCLDDYALLREGGPNDPALVYRAPDANWAAYDKVLLEPVTLWRSGRKSLEPVPQEDLLRLVADFQSAVRTGLGEGFRLVDQAGPGVMRIRVRGMRVGDREPDAHHAGAGLVDEAEALSQSRAHSALEVGDEAQEILLRHRLERLPPAAPERHRLEKHLVVRRPVRVWGAIHQRQVVRAALAQKRGVVQETGHLRRRGGVPMGAATHEH